MRGYLPFLTKETIDGEQSGSLMQSRQWGASHSRPTSWWAGCTWPGDRGSGGSVTVREPPLWAQAACRTRCRNSASRRWRSE